MKYFISILSLIAIVCFSSCNIEEKRETKTSREIEIISQKGKAPSKAKTMDKADSLIYETIMAHGGELYDTAHYAFRFRDNNYTFHNKQRGYIYTANGQKDGEEIRDVLKNGKLARTINGVVSELSPRDIAKFSQALNSVIYFVTLPYKLKDAAVKKTYEGRIFIKNQKYDVLAVTFDQEGGGNDHDDEFRYWINSDSKTIDYLAYSYETNDGGVRFRSAYNPRTIDGIRFQDYVNYEAPIGTSLDKLPELYEAGKLKELSKIETENVVDLKN